jgi:hypothetical protein
MLITSTLNAQTRPQLTSAQAPAANESTTFHNEPIDGWNPGESQAMADLAPYSLAVIAGAAGIVSGFAEGPAAAISGAVALGAAGAGGALFMSGMNELGGGESNYGRSALIGAGVGAGLGALAGVHGGPIVGVLTGLVGAGGAFVAGQFLS